MGRRRVFVRRLAGVTPVTVERVRRPEWSERPTSHADVRRSPARRRQRRRHGTPSPAPPSTYRRGDRGARLRRGVVFALAAVSALARASGSPARSRCAHPRQVRAHRRQTSRRLATSSSARRRRSGREPTAPDRSGFPSPDRSPSWGTRPTRSVPSPTPASRPPTPPPCSRARSPTCPVGSAPLRRPRRASPSTPGRHHDGDRPCGPADAARRSPRWRPPRRRSCSPPSHPPHRTRNDSSATSTGSCTRVP